MNHVLLQLFQSRCHIASVICFIGDFPFPYAIFLFTIGLLEATLHLCVSECVYVLKLDLTIYIESFIFRRVLNQFPLFFALASFFLVSAPNWQIYKFKKWNKEKLLTIAWEQHIRWMITHFHVASLPTLCNVHAIVWNCILSCHCTLPVSCSGYASLDILSTW